MSKQKDDANLDLSQAGAIMEEWIGYIHSLIERQEQAFPLMIFTIHWRECLGLSRS